MNLETQAVNGFEEVLEESEDLIDESSMECCFTCVDGIEEDDDEYDEEARLEGVEKGAQEDAQLPDHAGMSAVYGVMAPEVNQFAEDDEDLEDGPLPDMVFDEDQLPAFAITDEDVERAFNGKIPPAESLTDEHIEAILIAAVERMEESIQADSPGGTPLCFGGKQGDYARYAVTLAREAARAAGKLKKLDPAMLDEAKRIRFINEANTTANQKETGVRFDL